MLPRMQDELFEVVDESGKVLGLRRRRECHGNPALIHQAVHLLVFNRRGELFLQQRAQTKDIQPGKWDSAVGGHVSAGEDLDTALTRELREELGVTKLSLDASGARVDPILRYRWDSDQESELVFSFIVTYGGPFAPDGKEVSEGRFWSFDEIRANLGKGLLTPNFEHEFGLIEKAAAEAALASKSAREPLAVVNTSTSSSAAGEQGAAKDGRGKR